MSLTRNGNPTTLQQIDKLAYSYGTANSTNQLTKVVDNATTYKAGGFVDSAANTADDYSYDTNGNMTKDNNKNITAISYNHLNLPVKITFGTTGNIVYLYNAAGQKVRKTVTEGTNETITDYLGGYQYVKEPLLNPTLKFFPTAEGYVEASGSSYKYIYQYKDHLGNIRLSYDKTLAIKDENNYYPFGLKHMGYGAPVVNSNYKYKYNGKELQDELGLNFYDYGARNYDPAIGRWMNIDPLAETSRRFSPYVYANNNPVYFIDPDGMSAEGSGDPTYLLQSVNYDKKTGNYTIKENVTVSNSNSSSVVDEFGGTTEVTNTTTTSANFTTVVNSKGEIVSKSNSIETTKTTTERNTSNILDTGKVTDSKTTKTSDKSLTGPLAKTFEGSVDGMKDLVVPLKSDLQNFRETTKDIPGAGDGTTGGFGRLGEALIDYVRGTATSYSSAMTKSKRGKLEDRDFNNAGYIVYSKTLKQVGTTLNKK